MKLYIFIRFSKMRIKLLRILRGYFLQLVDLNWFHKHLITDQIKYYNLDK